MNTLVTFTILLSCFAGLNALTCQLCSILNSDCSDPSMGSYSGNYSVACGSNDNACSKIVVKLDGKVTTTTRSCSSSCDEKCVSALTLETCQYCCTTDDCNGASTLTFSLVTALAAVVFGALAAHGV
ncbi:uncharacterized protein LOC110990382 [Acanthaster planci]|uniref:Uncharacterized protein LOC110990382 n=1 Tax=Acanthaster planci TaxID=133434 RepID=A0A8B8A537_ACAPL|nr:uncharacterized protein LOC110990382 [Acanthaster planci]